MSSLRAVEREREAARAVLRQAERNVDDVQRRRRLLCNHCGKRTTVCRLVYLQYHYYVEPYGCTGGAYWREGEGRFLCPHCKYENRLIYREEVVALRRYFAKERDVYPEKRSVLERDTTRWCN